MIQKSKEKIIFIVGMARTGTTLMARSLSKGPDIYFLNETHFMREYQHLFSQKNIFLKAGHQNFIANIINQFITIQRKDYYRKAEFQEHPDAVEKVFEMFNARNEKNFIELLKCLFLYEAELHGKKLPGDQTPNHIFFIDQIIRNFPGATFINMIRDPRAVVLSQKNKWKASKRQKQPRFEIIRTKINYHPITQSILWLKSIRAGLVASKKYGNKKIQSIHYEQLVSEPEKYLKRLCEFIGTTYSEEMLKVSVSMSSNVISSSTQGMDSSLTDNWRSMLSATEIYIVEQVCGKYASQLGYKMSGISPNYFMLLLYFLFFPFQILVAYFFSAGRFKIFNKIISKFLS